MLSTKVLEWLNTTGFPLEMEAASAFRAAGFDVRQSAVLPDPQSDKGRELDVLAQDPDILGVVEVSFVIECKSSSNPWVVFTSEDALSGYNRLFAFALTSQAAKSSLNKRTNSILWDKYISRASSGGYGFRQALRKDSDPAYTAAIGALKACNGLAQDREASPIPRLAFAFPVIVIDSPLFECARTAGGHLTLTEVHHSEFLFSAHIPEHVGCCVHVVTKEHLPTFARWAKELSNEIRKELENEALSAI